MLCIAYMLMAQAGQEDTVEWKGSNETVINARMEERTHLSRREQWKIQFCDLNSLQDY